MGIKQIPPEDFVSHIFKCFNNGMLAPTVRDPLLRRHRLSVFSYIANGYLSEFGDDDQRIIRKALVHSASPFFTSEDLKGFSLEILVQHPKEIMKKINKVSKISRAQQAVFDGFVASLRRISTANELTQLKAFLSTLGEIPFDVEDESRSLELFHLALQDKDFKEIKQIIALLIANNLLPEEAKHFEQTFIEAARYSKQLTVDETYTKSMAEATNDENDPKPDSHTKVFAPELQIWLDGYFEALYQNGYRKRDAEIVTKAGFLQGQILEVGVEVTPEQRLAISKQLEAYEIANHLKQSAFGDIEDDQRTMLYLTDIGAEIDLVNQDNEISETAVLDGRYKAQIDSLRTLIEGYGVNPNEPAPFIHTREIPSDRPLKPYYAIRGGMGIDEVQIVQSRGRAIDVLIKEGRVDRSLKLAMLFYMYNW
ncbi:MAG: hypothetical protein K2Q34_01690 [Alphaproteobacteria bacterium]|nr:hypothetical protein [Alphaproteobacteria bacterium]